MNASQVARIAHEVQRTYEASLLAWEKLSPAYRSALTVGAAMTLEGRIPTDGMQPAVAAVFSACMPAPLDLNEESGVEPDRKPGFSLNAITRRAPAYRELEKPGEVVKTFV